MTWEDLIVNEVRTIREKLSSDLAFDVKAIFADMRQRQEQCGKRLVTQVRAVAIPNGSDVILNTP